MSSFVVTNPVLFTGLAPMGLLAAKKLNKPSRLVFKTLASLGFIWSALPAVCPPACRAP